MISMVTVVFTPAYQVYLTRRCAFSCDYCNFPNLPSPVPPSPKLFRSYLRTAQRLAAWQVTLTSGEGIDRLPEIESTMRYYGFSNWYEYIYELCQLTLSARGRQPLMPVLDIGPIPTKELRKLAPVVPLIRLMLDTVDPALAATVHAKSPQKSPLLRSLALNDIGRVGIPVVTGIRVGMGESHDSWIDAVEIANEVHERHGNVMGFHIIPFMPLPYSRLREAPPVSSEVLHQSIRSVRQHLHSDIPVVAEVCNRLALAPEAVISGSFDFGPIYIADNERFDLDMLNAVDAMTGLLAKIHVEVKCAPVLRENFQKWKNLTPDILDALSRFSHITECLSSDTPESGTPVPVPSR